MGGVAASLELTKQRAVGPVRDAAVGRDVGYFVMKENGRRAGSCWWDGI